VTLDEAEELATLLLDQGRIEQYELRPSYPAPRKLADVTDWDVACYAPLQGWMLLRSIAAVLAYEEISDEY
jgi:hypothetical protein